MAADTKKANIIISAFNKTDKAFNSISKQFSKIEKQSSRLGRTLTTTLTAPIVGGLGFATKAAVEFDKVMLDVGKNVKGLDASNIENYEKSLLRAGASSLLGAQGLAKLASEGGKLGKNTDEAIKFAETAERIAVAFDFERGIAGAEEAGRVIGKLESSFQITTKEVEELADAINFFGDNTASNSKNITDILVRQGSVVANSTGLARNEIAALAATFDATAPSPEIAATGLKNFTLALTAGGAATKKQKDAFKALGLSAEELAKRMQTDAKGAILDVVSALNKLPDDKRGSFLINLFGKESIGSIAPVVSSVENLANALDQVNNKDLKNSALKEFERINNADSSQLEKALKSIEAAGIVIGQVVLPPLAELAKKISLAALEFQDFATANPQLVEMGVIFAGIAAAVGPAFFIVGQFAGAISSVSAIIGSLGASGATLGTTFAALTGPIGLTVAALVAGGALIIANWDKVSPFFLQVGEQLKTIFGQIGQIVSAVSSSLVSKLNEWLQPIGGIQGALQNLKGTASVVFSVISNQVTTHLGVVSDVLGGVLDVLTGQKTAWEALKDVVASAVNRMISLVLNLNEDIKSAFDIDLVATGVEIMNGLFRGITAGATKVINKAKEIASSITSAVKGVLDINSPSRVFQEIGKFTIAGLTLGLANVAPAELAAENAAVKVLAAFEQKLEDGKTKQQETVNGLLGSASGQFSFGGGQQGFSGGGFSGGGFQEPQALQGFFDASQAGKELEELQTYFNDRIAILTENGLVETAVFEQVEAQKQAAIQETRDFQKRSLQAGFGEALSILQTFAGQQSGIYRAMFAVTKGFAFAEATVAGFQAIQKALASAPFPANIPAVALTTASTAANIAGILGTGASFDGGGFTGTGARTGGVDGIGGFPATIHPNESIIDHTKGQSLGGDTISVNVTIQGDANDSTVARLKSELKSEVMGAIVDAKRRGGSRARAL